MIATTSRRSKETFPQRRQRDGQKAHGKMLDITNYQRNASQNYNEASPQGSEWQSKNLHSKLWRGWGEKGALLHCWWECKLVQSRRFLKKLNMELPYDPAIPLLDIYSEKTITQKDACTPVFPAALLEVARPCRQPKCSLMDEWIKMWCILSNGILLSHKKGKIILFSGMWLDLEIVILSEVSQIKTNIMWYCLYAEYKK